MIKLLSPYVIAFAIVLIGTPFIKKLAVRVNAIDKPDARKVHQKVMPRLGGLAICLGFWASILLTQELTKQIWGLLAGGLLICLIGIWDDLQGVSPKTKLLVQILSACIILWVGIKVDFLTHPIGGIIPLGYLSYPLTILWIIGITNAVNLIDGLDGLAAGVSFIAAITLGLVSWLKMDYQAAVLAFILAAGTLGFLRYNFHPAKIFMGDTGSLFLGFNLAVMAITGLTKVTTVISLFLPVIILGIPIFDTLLAIFRRFLNGKPILSPDKEHLHHRLLALGFSHKHTVLAIYGVSIVLGLSALLMAMVTTAQGMLILIAVTLGVFIVADRVGVLKSVGLKKKLTNEKTANDVSR